MKSAWRVLKYWKICFTVASGINFLGNSTRFLVHVSLKSLGKYIANSSKQDKQHEPSSALNLRRSELLHYSTLHLHFVIWKLTGNVNGFILDGSIFKVHACFYCPNLLLFRTCFSGEVYKMWLKRTDSKEYSVVKKFKF